LLVTSSMLLPSFRFVTLACAAAALGASTTTTLATAAAEPTAPSAPSLCPVPASPEAAQAWLRDMQTEPDGAPFEGPSLDLDRTWTTRALTVDDVPFLMGLPNVQTLMLRFSPHGPELLARLGCLPALRALEFQGNHFTATEMRALAQGLAATPRPLGITFVDDPIGDDGLAALAAIPTLEILALRNVGIRQGSWLQAFRGHRSLKRLTWLSSADPSQPQDTLDRCNLSALADTRLDSLLLAGLGLEDRDLAALGAISTLKVALLPNNALHGCVAPLAAAKVLTSLSLASNPLTATCVGELGALASLKTLTVASSSIALGDLREAATRLPALRTIRTDAQAADVSSFLASFAGRTPPLCIEDFLGERVCSSAAAE
jgi:hypothetical protein